MGHDVGEGRYFTDREYGKWSRTQEVVDERVWGGLCGRIETGVDNGSLGHRFPRCAETESDGGSSRVRCLGRAPPAWFGSAARRRSSSSWAQCGRLGSPQVCVVAREPKGPGGVAARGGVAVAER